MKYLFALLLLVHVSHTYILLTANLDDVQALAKELVNSPILEQFKRIWRRASKQFTQQVIVRPSYSDHREFVNRASKKSAAYGDASTTAYNIRRAGTQGPPAVSQSFKNSPMDNQTVDEIINLGKNASFYLNSMKQIMENERDPPPPEESDPVPTETDSVPSEGTAVTTEGTDPVHTAEFPTGDTRQYIAS